MKKIIITGADGFVGSNTVNFFLKNNMEVLAIDMVSTPKRLNKDKNLSYLNYDLSNLAGLSKIIKHNYYDTFIHFAWAGSAGVAREDYHLQMQNAINTVECLKIASQIGCNRFVCAGSIMEYEVEYAVHTQGSKPAMGYIYGMGKHVAHCMCKSMASKLGIDLIWPMITNAYGIGEMSPRFLNTTLRKIINKEQLNFTSATQNYDFVYVTDVAKAFFLIAQNGKPFFEYMIGSGKARPLKDFILEMINSCAPSIKPVFGQIPFTGTNLPLEKYNINQLVSDCGYKPDISFSEGTKMTMEWLKKEENKES